MTTPRSTTICTIRTGRIAVLFRLTYVHFGPRLVCASFHTPGYPALARGARGFDYGASSLSPSPDGCTDCVYGCKTL